MKKNSFMQGAVIATIAIIITKIIGLLYVIPFYNIIGDKGGALYGYAYTIYSTFLSLSTVGIPLAMSKLVSEYNAKGYYHLREKAYKQGKMAITIFALFIFILLFVFATPIAKLILGDIKGGNTIKDITHVIRVISIALLVIPSLSISRGYLQGNKYITASSMSQVVEQIYRVIVVIFGSYIMLKLTNSTTKAVSIACFGATIGGIAAYIYLKKKIKQNKVELEDLGEEKEAEKKVKTKDIWIKIFKYAIPFVLIDVVGNACMLINMFTVVKILVNNCNYNITDAEIVMSTLTTWGSKLCMIVSSVATGITISLLPNITDSYVKKDENRVTKYINDSVEMILYLAIPMTVGLSFLSDPVWEVFYGNHNLAADVFKIFIFNGLTSSLYTVILTIMQSIDKYKVVYLSLIVEVLLKLVLQYPLMILFNNLGLGAYIGCIMATIISTLSTIIISLCYIRFKMKIKLKESVIITLKITISTIIMYIVLYILNNLFKINIDNRLNALIVIIINTILGGSIYLLLTYNIFTKIFGKNAINKIKRRLKIKQKPIKS